MFHYVYLLFKLKMYECTELGLRCKDKRGFVTITCFIPSLLFCDEIKIRHEL